LRLGGSPEPLAFAENPEIAENRPENQCKQAKSRLIPGAV
jgi:hypothetical protein